MFKNKKLKVAMEIAFAVSAAGVATIIHNAPVSAASTFNDAAKAQGQAKAQILQQITSASAGTLDFGKVVPTAQSGTVVIDSSGNITSTGGARYIPSTGAHVATLTFSGEPNQNIFIDAPAQATISNGTQSMNVQFNYPSLPSSIGATGTTALNYGGVLNVGANQAPGIYTGTYDIFVTYVA